MAFRGEKRFVQQTVRIKKNIICGRNLVLSLCNKNLLDALFILRLILQSTSTYYGHICSPTSGGILYIYNRLVRIVLFIWLSVGPVGMELHGKKHIKLIIKVFFHQLIHKIIALKGVLKFTLKQLQHFSV